MKFKWKSHFIDKRAKQQCRQFREGTHKSDLGCQDTVEGDAMGLQEGTYTDWQIVNENTQTHLKFPLSEGEYNIIPIPIPSQRAQLEGGAPQSHRKAEGEITTASRWRVAHCPPIILCISQRKVFRHICSTNLIQIYRISESAQKCISPLLNYWPGNGGSGWGGGMPNPHLQLLETDGAEDDSKEQKQATLPLPGSWGRQMHYSSAFLLLLLLLHMTVGTGESLWSLCPATAPAASMGDAGAEVPRALRHLHWHYLS